MTNKELSERLLEIKVKGGNGFIDGKKIYLTRCPEDQKENYAMAVASGRCAWCGYNANLKGE